MRKALRPLPLVVFLLFAVPTTGSADPIAADIVIDLGRLHVWPNFAGGGRLHGEGSSGRFLLDAQMDLGRQLFCLDCEPPSTINPHVFALTLQPELSQCNCVMIGDSFYPAGQYNISFAGEFRLSDPLLLGGALGDPRPVTLSATVTGTDAATGRQAFSLNLGGRGRAELIQTEFGSELTRGVAYDFTPAPIPEPASVMLLGTGMTALVLSVRRRRADAGDHNEL
jgi:hypothetical protein